MLMSSSGNWSEVEEVELWMRRELEEGNDGKGWVAKEGDWWKKMKWKKAS